MRMLKMTAMFAIMFGWAGIAHAQLLFQISPAERTTYPGTTVTFSGTLTNSGPAEIFLNSANVSLFAPGLTTDASKFFDGAPASLLPGGTWSGDILDVAVAKDALLSNYVGNFSLQGGGDDQARDPIAEQPFTVTLTEPASVPKSEAEALAGAVGLVMIAGLCIRRRSHKRA